MHTSLSICMYIHIYIYIERERDALDAYISAYDILYYDIMYYMRSYNTILRSETFGARAPEDCVRAAAAEAQV